MFKTKKEKNAFRAGIIAGARNANISRNKNTKTRKQKN